MRIAHIVCTYPPYHGGMGNSVFALASALSDLGHEVEVFTPQYYEEKEIRSEEAPPAKIHAPDLEEQIDSVHRLTPDIQYGNAAHLPHIGHELDNFDIVHLHYPFFGTANLVRKWKLRNPEKPLVMTYHMDARGPGWKGLAFKLYSRYWMPRILSSADALLSASFEYMAASEAADFFSVTKEKWTEAPFGVDINRFSPMPPSKALFDSLGLQDGLPVLLFVGGMDAAHYFKGVPVFLQAIRILKNNGTPCQAVLVGDGVLRSGFEQRAAGYGLRDAVHFAGHVSDDDLPEYYRLADLFILPSINSSEAFGMVLLEAFASGVPVVASDLPGVGAVAKEGGLTVRPNDPQALANGIGGYFDPENDQAQWRARVRLLAEEKYSWKTAAERVEEVYRGLALT